MDALNGTVAERLRLIVAKEVKIDPAGIKEDSSLVDNLGVESAELVSLLYAIEGEFDIEITDEEADTYIQFRDVVQSIEAKVA